MKRWFDSLTDYAISSEVPKDFYTCREIAQARGLSIRETSRLLEANIKSGKIIARKYRIKSGLRVLPVMHYGPK